MRTSVTALVYACLWIVVAPSVARGQDLRLEISVPKTKIKGSEPVNLTVKLINTSGKTYYVAGDTSIWDGTRCNIGKQVHHDSSMVGSARYTGSLAATPATQL